MKTEKRSGSSDWLCLNKLDKKLGLKKVFIEKDSVINVSRITIGRKGNTSITYKTRKGKIAIISVFEEPKYIFNKLSY